MRTNVSPVYDVGEQDQCGVLNLTTSVENNATYITNQFVQFKLKNTCADIEDEAIEVSSISVVDDVDKCGVLC